MPHVVKRYHDISCGHRVVGHEGHCRHLHGHNYRIHFTCGMDIKNGDLDNIGRVIDFSEVKSRLCMWVENNWDHRFLAWEHDTLIRGMKESCRADTFISDMDFDIISESVVFVPFNPTAENLAQYLVDVIGPQQLKGTDIELIEVLIEETAKCHASYSRG